MSRHLSPGGQLLRSSRLFSLPRPLPRPENQSAARGSNRLSFRNSDTATTIHPTHQALATSEGALARGDWGLKRAIPLRQGKRASKPTIRVTAHDTIEHVTDYESSTDHARTLEKFQEFGLALARRSRTRDPWRSAFDESQSSARVVQSQAGQGRKRDGVSGSRRWKHSGPLVHTMSEAEFEWYLKRELKHKLEEFRPLLEDYLRVKKLNEMAAEVISRHSSYSATTMNSHLSVSNQVEADQSAIPQNGSLNWEYHYYMWLSQKTAEEFGDLKSGVVGGELSFAAHVRQMLMSASSEPMASDKLESERSDDHIVHVNEATVLMAEASRIDNAIEVAHKLEERGLSSWDNDWENYVRQSIRELRSDTKVTSELNELLGRFLDIPGIVDASQSDDLISHLLESTSGEKATVEFSTHPSAGISYLQANSTLENHPLLGPRARRTPQQARVLVARGQGGRSSRTTLGVAGFAAGEGSSYMHQIEKIDVQTIGGQKVWIQPQRAYIDGRGTVQLVLREAIPQDVYVKENTFLTARSESKDHASKQSQLPRTG